MPDTGWGDWSQLLRHVKCMLPINFNKLLLRNKSYLAEHSFILRPRCLWLTRSVLVPCVQIVPRIHGICVITQNRASLWILNLKRPHSIEDRFFDAEDNKEWAGMPTNRIPLGTPSAEPTIRCNYLYIQFRQLIQLFTKPNSSGEYLGPLPV